MNLQAMKYQLKVPQIMLLQQFKGVGRATILKVETYLNDERIEFPDDIAGLTELVKQISSDFSKFQDIRRGGVERAYQNVEHLIQNSIQNEIAFLGYNDDLYPAILRDLKDFPLILHYKGVADVLSQPSVAIIGTREPSDYGIERGAQYSSWFAQSGMVIVSGLALGCDTIGHEAALEADIPTVAVMAAGLDSIYPKKNLKLSENILSKGGLLISEYSVGNKPLGRQFVERDRIQAGISAGLFVIETGIQGGTMHTVRFAKEMQRETACLYSHLKDGASNVPSFQGNRLLVESGGARQIASEKDVVDFIEVLKAWHFARCCQASPAERSMSGVDAHNRNGTKKPEKRLSDQIDMDFG